MDVPVSAGHRAVDPAHVLREDAPRLDPTRDVDAHVALERRPDVVRPHRGRDADGGRLVAAPRVERARDLPLLVEDVAALLDPARHQHVAVQCRAGPLGRVPLPSPLAALRRARLLSLPCVALPSGSGSGCTVTTRAAAIRWVMSHLQLSPRALDLRGAGRTHGRLGRRCAFRRGRSRALPGGRAAADERCIAREEGARG